MIYTVRSRAGFRYGVKVANDLWQFDSENLTADQWNAIQRYCVAYPEVLVPREASPKPVPVVVEPKPEPVVDMRPDVVVRPAQTVKVVDPIAQNFKRDLQRQIDLSMAQDRLNFWGHVHGLRDSERNQRLIIEWLDKNVKGYISGPGIDAAVANLRRGLEWDTPKPAASVSTSANTEMLGRLPNGETQLSIKRPIPQTASAAQAKDWLARFREANNLKFNAFGR